MAVSGGVQASAQIEIVDPTAPSPIAISENQLGSAPFGGPLMSSAFGGDPIDSLAHGLAEPYADLGVTSFREEMSTDYLHGANSQVADLLDAARDTGAGGRAYVGFRSICVSFGWMA